MKVTISETSLPPMSSMIDTKTDPHPVMVCAVPVEMSETPKTLKISVAGAGFSAHRTDGPALLLGRRVTSGNAALRRHGGVLLEFQFEASLSMAQPAVVMCIPTQHEHGSVNW